MFQEPKKNDSSKTRGMKKKVPPHSSASPPEHRVFSSQKKPIDTGHVAYGDEVNVPLHLEVSKPPRTEYPLMVYESFGRSNDDLANIYHESINYPGESIAILGTNVPAKPSDKKQDAKAMETAHEQRDTLCGKIAVVAHHDVSIQPFIWLPTTPEGGYNFPYYEVRTGLMKVAQKRVDEKKAIVKKWISDADDTYKTAKEAYTTALEKNAEDEEAKNQLLTANQDLENKGKKIAPYVQMFTTVVYRWIDGDACNDTGNNIPAPMLINLAREPLEELFTGIYKWGYSDVQNSVIYTPMIKLLNEKECLLRTTWFKINAELEKTISSPTMKGFYLPEATMMMNQSAHDTILNALSQDKKIFSGEGQQRESEAAFQTLESSRKIEFITDYLVIKPVKDAGTAASYLRDIENYWQNMTIRRDRTPEQLKHIFKDFCEKNPFPAFCNILKNVRQSAFDNNQWYFVKDQQAGDWDATPVGPPPKTLTFSDVANGKYLEKAQLYLNMSRIAYASDFYEALLDAAYKECLHS